MTTPHAPTALGAYQAGYAEGVADREDDYKAMPPPPPLDRAQADWWQGYLDATTEDYQ